MRALVAVRYKEDVPDSEGRIIFDRAQAFGLTEIRGIRSGRLFEIEIEGGEQMTGERVVKELCSDLLVNAAVEEFEIISITV